MHSGYSILYGWKQRLMDMSILLPEFLEERNNVVAGNEKVSACCAERGSYRNSKFYLNFLFVFVLY